MCERMWVCICRCVSVGVGGWVGGCGWVSVYVYVFGGVYVRAFGVYVCVRACA